MRDEGFDRSVERIVGTERSRYLIGTLSEKTLHAVLKDFYSSSEEEQEVRIGRLYADVLKGNDIFEIQTRSFNSLRKKLDVFLEDHDVTVIYPIAKIKWISWIDPVTGELTDRRKSPKTGSRFDAFRELYRIKPYLSSKKLHIKLVLLELTEYRMLNGWSADRKRGSVRFDRVPDSLMEEIDIRTRSDYLRLVPDSLLNKDFGVSDFSKEARISEGSAQLAVNVLGFLGVIARVGKSGRAYVYRVNSM